MPVPRVLIDYPLLTEFHGRLAELGGAEEVEPLGLLFLVTVPGLTAIWLPRRNLRLVTGTDPFDLF